jgi:hypothetical protein
MDWNSSMVVGFCVVFLFCFLSIRELQQLPLFLDRSKVAREFDAVDRVVVPESSRESTDSTPLFDFNVAIRTGDTAAAECTIFMAPSSLNDPNNPSDVHAGYGIFTTRFVKSGESFQPFPDQSAIAVADWHTNGGPTRKKEREQWSETFDNYWWGRGTKSICLFSIRVVRLCFQFVWSVYVSHTLVLHSH